MCQRCAKGLIQGPMYHRGGPSLLELRGLEAQAPSVSLVLGEQGSQVALKSRLGPGSQGPNAKVCGPRATPVHTSFPLQLKGQRRAVNPSRKCQALPFGCQICGIQPSFLSPIFVQALVGPSSVRPVTVQIWGCIHLCPTHSLKPCDVSRATLGGGDRAVIPAGECGHPARTDFSGESQREGTQMGMGNSPALVLMLLTYKFSGLEPPCLGLEKD